MSRQHGLSQTVERLAPAAFAGLLGVLLIASCAAMRSDTRRIVVDTEPEGADFLETACYVKVRDLEELRLTDTDIVHIMGAWKRASAIMAVEVVYEFFGWAAPAHRDTIPLELSKRLETAAWELQRRGYEQELVQIRDGRRAVLRRDLVRWEEVPGTPKLRN